MIRCFAYSYPPCVVGIEGQWNQVQYRWGDIETFGAGVERGRVGRGIQRLSFRHNKKLSSCASARIAARDDRPGQGDDVRLRHFYL